VRNPAQARRTSAMASAFIGDSMVSAILGNRPSTANASVFSRSLWAKNSRFFLRGGGQSRTYVYMTYVYIRTGATVRTWGRMVRTAQLDSCKCLKWPNDESLRAA